jgi:hypothetical protein
MGKRVPIQAKRGFGSMFPKRQVGEQLRIGNAEV